MGCSSKEDLLAIFVLMILWCSSNSQNIREDGNTILLKNVIDTLDSLSLQLQEHKEKIEETLEEHKEKIEATLEDVQDKLTDIEEHNQKIEATLKEQQEMFHSLQQCPCRDQISHMQDLLATVQQQIGDSLQQCSTIDQLTEFQNVFATDECKDRSHNCSSMAMCVDSIYSYKCVCNSGYTGDGFTCQDIDECSEDNAKCSANEVCSNIVGNYTCNCQEGYRREGDTCQDIDECSEDNAKCSANEVCSNTVGNYTCNCQEGYRREGDTCQDVDECSEDNAKCSAYEVCSNTPGNYTCNCHEGYRREGDTCQGPVCESPSILLPSLGCLTLLEEKLNWNDAKAKCNKLGMKLAENIKKDQMETLSQHFYPMIPDGYNGIWIGLREGRFLTSGEEVSQDDWRKGEPDKGNSKCGFVFLKPPSLGLADDTCTGHPFALCQSLPQ